MTLTVLGATGGSIWSALGMLFVVLLILVLAWLTTRWIASRGVGGVAAGGFQGDAKSNLSILAQLTVGRGERILLVRLGERCLLLGVTEHSVTLLKELSGEEAAEWFVDVPARPTFLEAFQENLRKKK